MRRSRSNPWIGIGFDAWRLSVSASAVIGLRTLRIAGSGDKAEVELMLAEKIDAGMALQTKAFRGGLGATPASASARTLAHYQRRVNANLRRLTKG